MQIKSLNIFWATLMISALQDIFSEFGEVAEVKIQKPTPKSGGMKVPYFCFVVFEEASSAQVAIDKKANVTKLEF